MWIRQGHSLGKDHCFLSSLPLLWRALPEAPCSA